MQKYFHFSRQTLAWFKLLIYLCNVKRKRPHRLTIKNLWRGGRVVDCTGLENRRTERYRGFESLPLRKKSGNNFHCFLILFYTSGKLACRRSIKQNRLQTPPGVCWFLAKEPQTGMGEQSEANSDLKADRKQNKENARAFLFLAKESLKGMGEQSEANSYFETNTIRRLQDTQ